MTDTQAGQARAIALDGELTVFTVGRYHDLPTAWHGSPGDVELDLAGITDIDTAGVQLLAWFRRQLEQESRRLFITNPSAPVQDALQIFRLDLSIPAGALGVKRP